MFGLGTIVNTIAVVVGGIIGLLLKNGLKNRYQENASIEIFDNGSGMDYNDLSEKYVLIGKDKREDDQISEEINSITETRASR